MQTILYELSLYPHVWYFAPPRLVPPLTELAAAGRYDNIAVHRYPPLAAEVAHAGLTLNRT